MAYQRYYPKRPVKSFQDLEVYQKTLGLAIEIAKRVTTEIARNSNRNQEATKSPGTAAEVATKITNKLLRTVLELPKLIAEAHSRRFGDPQRSVETLEETMLKCNLAVVYLEQYRDICNVPRDKLSKDKTNSAAEYSIEPEFFEEQIKEYLRVRGKIMRLQRAWKKFM